MTLAELRKKINDTTLDPNLTIWIAVYFKSEMHIDTVLSADVEADISGDSVFVIRN